MIKISFGIIFKVKGPVIVFIYDKYVFNQGPKTCVCIIKYFISVFIKMDGEENTWKKKKDREGSGESTTMVVVTKEHLHC